ncbi:hypothetical protein OO185_01535 [Prosthecochloris sp. SCSIO W1102]|uniref:hypothetical protein n=1 Tax=Prosthecochloris sp. SCSIO W1102 TaxID=2992243 RepID=UPI00223E2790|nr:hypothetical protein [Prosthecochloris sp. SCSIO W1102]UZJ39804.1 hypothetical protein OO185_01535 [Prosthecochloris sp. SCSIO W1102]
MNNSGHKHFIIWGVILLISALIEFTVGPVEEYLLRLSPISIYKLPIHAYFSIIATIIASLIAWLAALTIGGALGLFTAAGELASREKGPVYASWNSLSKAIRRTFNAIYVIPLVLTLSVVGTILLQLHSNKSINSQQVGFILIIASGITLAGQRIYIALDDAISTASSDDLILANSLYLGNDENAHNSLRKFYRLWLEAKFLISCRISLLTQAIEQAFHLSVVGVIILETTSVAPFIYEYIFPQEGAIINWGGGIGRVIIDGQNATNPELVAGAVWLILLIDSALAWLIRSRIYKNWIHPYRSNQS